MMLTVSLGTVVFVMFFVFMLGVTVGSYLEGKRPLTKEELIALGVSFNTDATKTGRITCDRPNVANTPKAMSYGSPHDRQSRIDLRA